MYEPPEIRIEASQKGWLAVRALLALVQAIAALETGEGSWEKYLSLKGAALLSMKAFERWHGCG